MLDRPEIRRRQPMSKADIVIGGNVKRLRLMKKLSQDRLAEKLDISHQMIQKIESGINRLSLSRAVEVCRHLTCSLEDLVDGVDGQPQVSAFEDCKLISEVELIRNIATISAGARRTIKELVAELARK
jgi:transcriptional regulator with XRE-family HTH domain